MPLYPVTLRGACIIFFAFACSSGDPSPSSEEKAKPAQDAIPAALADSVTPPVASSSDEIPKSVEAAPASKKVDAPTPAPENKEAEAATPPSAPALAPQTARVTATVENTSEQGNAYICAIKIAHTHGYGASTPPLASGSEIQARIQKTVTGSDKFSQSGVTVEITLRFQKPLATMQPPPPSWNIIAVH
jgi:hypothetical protein